MDQFGQEIHQIDGLTNEEKSQSIDSLILEWKTMYNISSNAITSDLFKLIIKRTQSMTIPYLVPTSTQIHGILLETRFNECIETRNKVKFVLYVYVHTCV